MSISKSRLAKLKQIKDSQIDYSDIPELGPEFWQQAKVVMPEKNPHSSKPAKNIEHYSLKH